MTSPFLGETLEQQIAQVTDQFLREAAYALVAVAAPPQPVVYMFADGQFNGWIGCRPYSTEPTNAVAGGRTDLRNAIAAMAWLPAARNADRLLVCWEDFTLRTHMDGPGEYVRAMMVADVPLLGVHTLTWWPFTLSETAQDAAEALTLAWIPAATGQQQGLPLPPPVADLIAIWRANRHRLDEEATLANATENDYRVSLVQQLADPTTPREGRVW